MLLDRQDRSDKMIEDKKDGPGEVICIEKNRHNDRILRKITMYVEVTYYTSYIQL